MMTTQTESYHPDDDEIPAYCAPRRTPHPSDTPISPYDKQLLSRIIQTEPHTGIEKELAMTAKRIRSTEGATEKNLNNTSITPTDDLRDTSINPMREATRGATNRGWAAARRAQSQQTNLQSLYHDWATLCERYLNKLTAIKEDDAGDSQGSKGGDSQ